jgi:hypothetical protein
MDRLNFFESANSLSKQLARKRGTPLNYFLSPYIERYLKAMETQMGATYPSNPLATALRGGMTNGMGMETANPNVGGTEEETTPI